MNTDTTQFTPGCYIDSHLGHYMIPAVIDFAQGYGFQVDPFAQYALARYDTDYHTDDYPNEAAIELSDKAEDYLNDNHSIPRHSWGWNDGDFGLYPHDTEDN